MTSLYPVVTNIDSPASSPGSSLKRSSPGQVDCRLGRQGASDTEEEPDLIEIVKDESTSSS